MLGATGFIGAALVERVLAGGGQVCALVRNASSIDPRPGLDVVHGDVADSAALDRVIAGAEAVVSALGPRRGESNATGFLAEAMTRVLAAMASNEVKRLVTVSGAAIRLPGEHKGFPHNVASAVVSVVARRAYMAKKQELDVLLASGVDWTAIRPTRVVDGEVTGHLRISNRAGDVGFSITRGDVAEALWAEVRERSFIRQAPYASS